MADRLLILVPHEHTHAPRSILEQARKLGPDVDLHPGCGIELPMSSSLVQAVQPCRLYSAWQLQQLLARTQKWSLWSLQLPAYLYPNISIDDLTTHRDQGKMACRERHARLFPGAKSFPQCIMI